MTWWLWTLVWIVLVAASLGVFFLIARGLWRKVMALMTELGTATDRLSAVADELDTISTAAAQVEDLAVFASPTRLRQQRIIARRSGGRRRTPRPGASSR